MAWRDELQRVKGPNGRPVIGGSFRGAAFFVEASSRAGGRRIATHEFPGRDDPKIDELGRKARQFSVDAFVIGPDYLKFRDALISALEDRSGTGELIHPYHGVKQCVCSSFSLNESTTDGGIAKFSITFDEEPVRETVPADVFDAVASAESSATAAEAAATDGIKAGLDVAGLPSFAIESATNAVEAAADTLARVAAPVTETTEEFARLTVQIDGLRDAASDLVATPAALAADFFEALGSLEASIVDPLQTLIALLGIAGADDQPAIVETTDDRVQEAANLAAIQSFFKRAAVIRACVAAVAVDYETFDQAILYRDQITDVLDSELATATDQEFSTLSDLRAVLVTAIPGDEKNRLETIEQNAEIPSVVLAFSLYGDALREAEIVDRNRVKHAGFVGGPIQVLRD